MGGVRVGTDTGVWEGNTVLNLYHTRHFLKVYLVHDAVSGRNNVDVIECGFGPVDKVETVFVTTLFYFTVLFEGVFVKATKFNGSGVVNNQLGLYHWVYLGWVTAFFGNGIT